jgi:glutaredoxin-related protein
MVRQAGLHGRERLNIFNRDRFFRLLTDGGLRRPIDGWARRFLAVQIFLCQRCPGQEILEGFPIEREMGIHARWPVIPQLRSVGGFRGSGDSALVQKEKSRLC